MGWDPVSDIKDFGRKLDQSVRKTASYRDIGKNAAAYFANPLAWQDVAGSAAAGATMRGGDPLKAGLAATPSLAEGGDSQQYMDLAAFNAALLAGAATGGLAAAYAAPVGVGWTAGGTAAYPIIGTGSAIGATALGTTAAAGTYLATQSAATQMGAGGGENAATPPDINEANDPDLAAQFKRIRKGARMLGRAGTIKYKGSGNLGSGDTLGDQLTVSG